MGRYRMAAFDMDGTLLNSAKRVSKGTQDAVAKALAAGREVVISTGRSVAECEDCADDLGGIRYSVCESGALVYDRLRKKILHRSGFAREVSDEILRIGTQLDAMPHVISCGEAITEAGMLERMDYYHMGIYSEMMHRVCVLSDDIRADFQKSGRGIEKINFYCATGETRDELRRRLSAVGDCITIAYAEKTSIEISPRGMTKASGLSWLCDFLGIDPAEVIAAGDADNDRDMLAFAGLSAAMGNASPSVREHCDIVVRDNDHDGCCDVIRHLMND